MFSIISQVVTTPCSLRRKYRRTPTSAVTFNYWRTNHSSRREFGQLVRIDVAFQVNPSGSNRRVDQVSASTATPTDAQVVGRFPILWWSRPGRGLQGVDDGQDTRQPPAQRPATEMATHQPPHQTRFGRTTHAYPHPRIRVSRHPCWSQPPL